MIVKLDYYPTLKDYGIEVPFLCEKYYKLIERTKKLSNITVINDATERELLDVFDKNFIETLLKDPDSQIAQTYELFDQQGNFHRYCPDIKKKPFQELVHFFKQSCSASLQACLLALETNFSYFIGGGFHHGYLNRGSGFCLLNDIVFSCHHVLEEFPNHKILVIDVDAHFGDGTAFCLKKYSSIHTYSIHMEKGWPLDGSLEDPNTHSDTDIAISNSREYIPKLKQSLIEILNQNKFDLAIIVQGADPYEKDSLESANLLKLTREEMNQRDAFIYQLLKRHNTPQTYLMSGGYGEEVINIYYDFFDFIEEKI